MATTKPLMTPPQRTRGPTGGLTSVYLSDALTGWVAGSSAPAGGITSRSLSPLPPCGLLPSIIRFSSSAVLILFGAFPWRPHLYRKAWTFIKEVENILQIVNDLGAPVYGIRSE